MTPEAAETIAIEALAFLAQDDELLGVFLGSTGLAPADLRASAGNAEMLASVLDFLLVDDRWVVRFCEFAKLPFDTPMAARAVLPGGQAVNWT